MKFPITLLLLALVFLSVSSAQAQLKDIPSQAEFDPILENADSKLKDFVATLTAFRVEAEEIDRDTFAQDLKSIQQLREMIQVTHSGDGRTNKGINMQRLVGILASFDDATLMAAKWKNGAELKMCQQLIQKQNPARYDQFSTQVAMELQLLCEVGKELFHPTLRAALAADEVFAAVADSTSTGKAKPR
jgi:hypothetical protein